MTPPEIAAQIARASRSLREADVLVANDLPEAAGRAAYLAAFAAAQAFIFQRSGRVSKTHRGVRSEFARLARDEPLIDRALPTFLARAYALKEQADYGTEPTPSLTWQQASEAISTAERFVACIASLLEDDTQ